MTPWNADRAAILGRIFPEMKLIHTVRDGRDVAASVANTWWGPDHPIDALQRWCERLRGVESASRMLDKRVSHIVHFVDLVKLRREETFQTLLEFLHVDLEGTQDFFDAEVIQQNAHLDTWRTRLNDQDAQLLDGLYRRMFNELVLDDVDCRPVNPDWNIDT